VRLLKQPCQRYGGNLFLEMGDRGRLEGHCLQCSHIEPAENASSSLVGERPLAADATGGGGTGPGVGINEDGVLVQRRHHDQQAVLSLYGIPYQRCQRALTQVQQDGLLLQEMLIPDCS